MKTALLACPEGKENLSGPTVINMSDSLPAGLLRLTNALITVTAMTSKIRPVEQTSNVYTV